MVLAADQFIITPAGAARSCRARGRPATRSVGHRWLSLVHRLGRDTMISLEGLTLCTGASGRPATSSARSAITSGWPHPNMFPEGKKEGMYQHG